MVNSKFTVSSLVLLVIFAFIVVLASEGNSASAKEPTPVDFGFNAMTPTIDSTCAQSTDIVYRIGSAGNGQPGCACTSDSDCWSGRCDCSTTGVAGSVCCRYANGRSCDDNDECQSGNCENGYCRNNIGTGDDNRPNGASCSVHEDCASGNCGMRNGRRTCL